MRDRHFAVGSCLSCSANGAAPGLSEKLHGLLDNAEGPEALPDERKELEELKALLPEIQEKVEDATEGLKTTNVAAEAEKDDLVSLERARCVSMMDKVSVDLDFVTSLF